MLQTTRTPHCQCLYEIENNLPRTKFCFCACPDQWQILNEREEKKGQSGETILDKMMKKFTRK